MTDTVVFYTHPKTKRMAIFSPSPRSRLPGESEADWLARCIARALPGATDIRVTTVAEVPIDRAFRDAWVLSNGKPQVDMAKARDIHRYRIQAQAQGILSRSGRETVARRRGWSGRRYSQHRGSQAGLARGSGRPGHRCRADTGRAQVGVAATERLIAAIASKPGRTSNAITQKCSPRNLRPGNC
jgi:hypothetical protein